MRPKLRINFKFAVLTSKKSYFVEVIPLRMMDMLWKRFLLIRADKIISEIKNHSGKSRKTVLEALLQKMICCGDYFQKWHFVEVMIFRMKDMLRNFQDEGHVAWSLKMTCGQFQSRNNFDMKRDNFFAACTWILKSIYFCNDVAAWKFLWLNFPEIIRREKKPWTRKQNLTFLRWMKFWASIWGRK